MKYSYDLSSLYNEDDISYYILGAFISDGNVVAHGIGNALKARISSKDKDWIEIIRNQICKELPLKDKGNLFELQIYSNEFGNWLVEHNCVMSKSLTVQLPNIPDKFFPDFLRGCIDGDGSLGSYNYDKTKGGKTYHYTYEKIYLCSGSEKFITSVSDKLKGFGLSHALNKVKQSTSKIGDKIITPKHDHFRLSTSGKSASELCGWLYYPGNRIAMPRKAAIAAQIVEKFSR